MMPSGEKRCTRCGRTKARDGFRRDGRSSDGRTSECRECSREYGAAHYAKNRESVLAKQAARQGTPEGKAKTRAKWDEWKARNPERFESTRAEWRAKHGDQVKANQKVWRQANKERLRSYVLLTEYGITGEQWRALFESQGCCCAICRVAKPDGRGWATDHDHATGKVRGVLCYKCNTGIGMFRDDPERMRRAISYVERHGLRAVAKEE